MMEPVKKEQEEKLHFCRKGDSKVRISTSVREQVHLELIHQFLYTKNSLINKAQIQQTPQQHLWKMTYRRTDSPRNTQSNRC